MKNWKETDFRFMKTINNQEFVEKVWYACVKHGYISTDYDVLGKFVDTLHIVM
jgi:hypothetical protein